MFYIVLPKPGFSWHLYKKNFLLKLSKFTYSNPMCDAIGNYIYIKKEKKNIQECAEKFLDCHTSEKSEF